MDWGVIPAEEVVALFEVGFCDVVSVSLDGASGFGKAGVCIDLPKGEDEEAGWLE